MKREVKGGVQWIGCRGQPGRSFISPVARPQLPHLGVEPTPRLAGPFDCGRVCQQAAGHVTLEFQLPSTKRRPSVLRFTKAVTDRCPKRRHL